MIDIKGAVYIDSKGRITSSGATMREIIAAWLKYQWERRRL